MKRTSLLSGLIFPALLAVVPGCDDPVELACTAVQLECGGLCLDVQSDDENCGACGNACDTGFACVQGDCASTCTAPTLTCGSTCCDQFADCIDATCVGSLAVLHTSLNDRAVDRDLFVLQDRTFALTELNGTDWAGNRVVDHAVLPDGRVVMVAAQTEDVFELFVVSPRGGAPTRVSATLPAGADVLPGIVVSRDGSRVLYRVDDAGVIDLYAAALATPGTAAKINGTLVAGGVVSRVFALSSDGRRAAYVADQDTDQLDEAYTVDLSATAPGAAVKLNPATTTDAVWDLRLSGDGTRVVYRQANNSLGRVELFAVDVATPGAATAITYADGAEGQVESYQLSPDGNTVVFTGGRDTFNESLWRAALAAPFEADELAIGDDYQWVRADFRFSPDGTGVYFRKVSELFGYDRLFRVDLATPGTLTQLSPVGDSSAEEVTDFALSADGRSAIYRGGADGAEGGNPQPETALSNVEERYAPALYHIDLTAAAPPVPTLLSPPPTLDREGIGSGYAVSADGTRVIFRADNDTVGFSDAYLVELATAGTARKVSPPLDETSDSSDVSVITRF